MPDMQKADGVMAICCSDIHLSLRPPVARSTEPDWKEAMVRSLLFLRKAQEAYEVPIVCAGDIFDKWNPPVELVNFAIQHLPVMYAVPGQHDLPYHNYEEVRRSAFWTLVEAGKIVPLHPDKPKVANGLLLWGFPWDVPLQDLSGGDPDTVAVVHSYIYRSRSTAYPGVPKSANIKRYRKVLGGVYAVFGDNHIGFADEEIVNCGCLIPRKSDERDLQPSIWLMREEGFRRVPLPTEQDKWLDPKGSLIKETLELADGFIEGLKTALDSKVNFENAVRRHLKENARKNKELQRAVLECLE